MLGKVRILYGFPSINLGYIVFPSHVLTLRTRERTHRHFLLMLKKSHRPFDDSMWDLGRISPENTTKLLVKTQVSMCEGFVSSANDRSIRAGDCEVYEWCHSTTSSWGFLYLLFDTTKKTKFNAILPSIILEKGVPARPKINNLALCDWESYLEDELGTPFFRMRTKSHFGPDFECCHSINEDKKRQKRESLVFHPWRPFSKYKWGLPE